MNCKPGDLAVVIKGVHGSLLFPCNCIVGNLFIIKSLAPGGIEPAWFIEPAKKCITHPTLVISSCSDHALRPIVPPEQVREHDQIKELELT